MSQAPLTSSTFPTPTDLNEIQGDIVLGIPKRFEDFLFFTIEEGDAFKKKLKDLIPCITTTAQIQALRRQIGDHKSKEHRDLIKVVGINIAFTSPGLIKLGVTDSLGDSAFQAGQLASAEKVLRDPGEIVNGSFVPNWMPPFKGPIDGLILICGECKGSLEEGVNKIHHILGNSIQEVLRVEGNVRPKSEKGHEHFGFMDGISVPAIDALTGHLPGQQVVDPGVLLFGHPGDRNAATRPSWTKNGSILVYRHLEQLVPEFHKFLRENPLDLPGLSREEGSELLGARLVGRWKSGAPIDVTPLKDDPVLAADPMRNNNFNFDTPDDADQSRCPFAAHVRKTNPRSDISPDQTARHSIMRAGIPFGPEVSNNEAGRGETNPHISRGLSFVCYQSALSEGFEFLQQSWANNVKFPPKTVNGAPFESGFEPLIGQNSGAPRVMKGTDPAEQGASLTLPRDFVVSKGGAYFFVPPISALETKLSA